MMMDGMEAVIFDLDGSLVDSMWIWKDIDIEYLGQFGLEPPRELQREIEGMSFSETAVYFKERFGLPDSLNRSKRPGTGWPGINTGTRCLLRTARGNISPGAGGTG